MRRLTRVSLALLLLCCASGATTWTTTIKAVAQNAATREASAQQRAVPDAWRAALERISADSMRGHLSFLSSDLLEGRKTPSRGLDIAAEYIAAQFRRAGLEPAGDDGYFQTANWSLASRDMNTFQLSFAGGGSSLSVSPEQASLGFSVAGFNFWTPDGGLALKDARLLKVDFRNSSALTRDEAAGKVVATELPELPRGDRARAFQVLRGGNEFMARLRSLAVPLVVAFDRAPPRAGRTTASSRLVDPDSSERESPLRPEPTAPLAIVRGAD